MDTRNQAKVQHFLCSFLQEKAGQAFFPELFSRPQHSRYTVTKTFFSHSKLYNDVCLVQPVYHHPGNGFSFILVENSQNSTQLSFSCDDLQGRVGCKLPGGAEKGRELRVDGLEFKLS